MDQLDIHWGPPLRARIAHGPRATERLLLEDVEKLLHETGEAILERPLRLVVPSNSLLRHVQERLLAHLERGVAGVDIQTHHSLAARLVEAQGRSVESGPDLFPLFARRFARQEPALARPLDHLNDGYRSVLLSVGDLLDAGLDPAHREALEEVLNADGIKAAGRAAVGRSHAIVRVAARTAEALNKLDLERSSNLLTRAAELVLGGTGKPAAAVLVYGYSDATGLTIDFLEALLKTHGGILYLDRPPDPVSPELPNAGDTFSRHFSERLLAGIPDRDEKPVEADLPRIDMFKAFGGEAEVREVGQRIRELLDGGAQPERIGVVARSLEPYRDHLRIQFTRLGIPFSSVGALGPRLPAGYRAVTTLELLRLRGRTPIERWLEARNPESLALEAFDLRVAFHTLGAGRLEDVGELTVAEEAGTGFLKLAVCSGLELSAPGNEAETARPFARKRRVARRALAEEARRGRALLARVSSKHGPRSCREQLELLSTLLCDDLGWSPDEPLTAELLGSASRALGSLPFDFGLEDEEFHELLDNAWSRIQTPLLGGQGGGVQILDVTEARARTFEHLFVLGLNRGRFPRVIHEDPILPDALRHVLARTGHGVLPDLALKLDGFAEERYLFAQLLSAAPSATLSWQEVDDDHVFQTPSPLIERLRWSNQRRESSSWREPPAAQALFTTRPESHSGRDLRNAYESAVLAGALGDRKRRRFREALEVALEEARSLGAPVDDTASLAAARVAILGEVDPRPGTREGDQARKRLGPYFGFVGPPTKPQDPRRRESVYVTTLERLAICPWQVFTKKILGIEPLPDPLELLPAIEARVLGNLVHDVLEQIVARFASSPPESLPEARQLDGVEVAWPANEEIERLVDSAARRITRAEGIALPGFDRVLSHSARGHIEQARLVDWPNGVSRHSVLAAEYRSLIDWPDAESRIGFRADRLDRTDDGLLLTDYKTGATTFGKKPSTKSIRRALATGRALQAMAYAVAAGNAGDRGRYLYLKPEVAESGGAEVRIGLDNDELVAIFESTVNRTIAAWQRGTFFPRLSEPLENKEPDACRYCDVAESCIRGDSGARTRLRNWNDRIGAQALDELEAGSEARSIAALWFLAAGGGGSR